MTSSPGAARLASASPAMYRPNSTRAACGSRAGSEVAMRSERSRKYSPSAGGTPSSWQITATGRGNESAACMSTTPSAERSRAADGEPPFSDQTLVDIRSGRAGATCVAATDGDELVGAAVVVPQQDAASTFTVELTVAPGHRDQGVATAIAGQLRAMVDAFVAGDVQKALEIHQKLLPVFTGMFRTQGVMTTKAALALQGLPAGPLRAPMVGLTPEETEQLKIDLAAGGVQL